MRNFNLQKNFSLIELLIVISIIGVLISILLPSLSNARSVSMRTVCLSNLNQIGIGLQSYIVDNNNHFPPQAESSSYSNWFGKKGNTTAGSRKPKNRILNYYITSFSVTIPDDAEIPIASCPAEWRAYKWYGTTYKPNLSSGINGLHITPVSDSRNILEIKSPSKFVTMTEHGGFKSVRGNNLKDYDYYHTKVGDRRWNQLFGDGHVQFNRILNGSVNTDRYTYDRDL